MIAHWINETWEHWKYGTATDAFGGTIAAWTKQTDVTARHRPLTGDHVIRENADTIIANAKFYMATTAAVKVGDELRHATKGNYEITAVIDPMSMGRFLQVEAKKL